MKIGIIFLFTTFIGPISFAEDISFVCGENGELKSYNYAGNKPVIPGLAPAQQVEPPASIAKRASMNITCGQRTKCYETVFPPNTRRDIRNNVLALALALKHDINSSTIKAIFPSEDQSTPSQKIGQLREAFVECDRKIESDALERATYAMKLEYSSKGPNRNKSSDLYDQRALNEVIRGALSNGVDPYLAIAILLMENPPIVNLRTGYEDSYGLMPMDALPLFEILGCSANKSEAVKLTPIPSFVLNRYKNSKGYYNDQSFHDWITAEIPDDEQRNLVVGILECHNCPAVLKKQAIIPNIIIPSEPGAPVVTEKKCSTRSTINHGVSAQFNESQFGCCVNVTHSPMPFAQVESKLKTALAMNFIRARIQSNLKNDPSISYSLQRYNGLGCLGCTEKISGNACMNKLNLAQSPVYGARIGDLIVNLLMDNPQIQRLVGAAASYIKKPVTSILCSKLGRGPHQISKFTFLDEQRQYLLTEDRKPNCENLFR